MELAIEEDLPELYKELDGWFAYQPPNPPRTARFLLLYSSSSLMEVEFLVYHTLVYC